MNTLTINNKEITADFFAYDDCHKIYILETEADMKEAKEHNYTILPLGLIEQTYNDSCPLKFINTWSLESVVEQDEDAIFNELVKA